uniref:C2H2-type domain-containing protein n=1 Tax=Schizaphis graminum TaxID=13262 RepID=A0A2S2PNQ8_SCHGA
MIWYDCDGRRRLCSKHLRYVRCPTCSRVFCCTKHRVQHERRVHVAVPGGPVIRRRFRSSQVLQQPEKQKTVYLGSHSPTNSRKRLHMDIAQTATQSINSGLRIMELRHHRRVEELRRTEEMRSTEERRRTEEQRWTMEQRAVMIEACARNILKARRSSLTTIRHLRPVAESSPAVPVPPPCTPHTTPTDAVESAATPVEWSVVVSSVGSPSSFYQTPMQTPNEKFPDTPSLQKLPDTPLQTLSDTPVNGKTPCNGGSVKRVSLGDSSTQKGFFWSNMARRFRLALRPSKPKIVENSNCPSPSASGNVDSMVNPYGNIQPRRPICNNDTLMTPVHPRPSLEAIRKAHEEASKAFNRFMTD